MTADISGSSLGWWRAGKSRLTSHPFDAEYEAVLSRRRWMSVYLRNLAATLAGLFLALALIVAVEGFSAVVHPLPSDFGGTMEDMCRHVERYPQWVLAAVVPMWAVAALVSVGIAQRIGNLYSAGIVGLLLLSALVFNLSKLPYPTWFKAVNLLAIPAAIVVGSRLSGRRKTAGRVEVN